MSAITRFFDGDELVVQAFLNAPMGIDRIILDGKANYLNEDFSLRIVVVDHTGHRTSYYDFALSMTFADGFESGDTTAWSSTVD